MQVKIDDLMARGLRELDVAKRRAIYQELQRYILTRPLPQPFGYSGWFYTDKRVRNFKLAKLAYESLTHTTVWLSASKRHGRRRPSYTVASAVGTTMQTYVIRRLLLFRQQCWASLWWYLS